jgi:uncharacterized protein Yka (UPF0111/DUF47 family)
MTATAHNIEKAFKALPQEEQAELVARLETIAYGEDEADRIAFERDRDIEEGKVAPIPEEEMWRRLGPPPA